MAKWIDRLMDTFSRGMPVSTIPGGMYHFQSPPEAETPYRLHLRIEPDGHGMLIINAHTTLHLNQTATEFAYYLVKGYAEDQAITEITRRYNIKADIARQDYQELTNKIHTLINTSDLDPVTYLDIDRLDPYTTELSAPYRLDCALTYRVTEPDIAESTPLERVKRELLSDEWKKILTKAWDAGIPHVIFTGGEPTLRPDLPELIAHCQSLGQVTGVLTDGLRLSDHEYLHALLNAGLDHVMLLLDPRDYQSWEAVTDSLVEDLFVTVHITVSSGDTTQEKSSIDRLGKMGVKNLSLTVQNPELKTALKECIDYATFKGFSIVSDIPVPYSAFNQFNIEQEENHHGDGAGGAWLYVEPDGDVLPTQGVNHVMGNLLTDEWPSIWSNRMVASH